MTVRECELRRGQVVTVGHNTFMVWTMRSPLSWLSQLSQGKSHNLDDVVVINRKTGETLVLTHDMEFSTDGSMVSESEGMTLIRRAQAQENGS